MQEVVETVGETVDAAIEGVKDVAGEVAEAGKEVLDELKEGDVVGAAKEVVEGVAETAGAAATQ